ncbi:MAG: hypothetical protein B7C24_06580 [Bacteroidetes bacterium 4572_77]|nr:MAG: hypothetical protein B7C24_06580 [Bacteroidetes bacterium 4572_77]
MKLNHVALNIVNAEEVTDFYQSILGLELGYQFELPLALSQNIFGIDQSLAAYFCVKEQLAFELFVLPKNMNKGVAHICLETSNREQLMAQCKNKGYEVNNIQRDNKPDLLFVWDKAGNCFEIKEGEIND